MWMMKNSDVPSGGALFLSVIIPIRQVGPLFYSLMDFRERL